MAFHPSHEDDEDLGTFEAKLRTEVRIKAPIDDVWDVLVDVEGWPDWNPCLEVEGRLEAGGEVAVRVATPDGPSRRYRATVETVDPPTELRWQGRRLVPGLLDVDHTVELQRRGPEQTKVVRRERYEGLLVPVFTRFDLDETRLGLEAMDRALKERVEAEEE